MARKTTTADRTKVPDNFYESFVGLADAAAAAGHENKMTRLVNSARNAEAAERYAAEAEARTVAAEARAAEARAAAQRAKGAAEAVTALARQLAAAYAAGDVATATRLQAEIAALADS